MPRSTEYFLIDIVPSHVKYVSGLMKKNGSNCDYYIDLDNGMFLKRELCFKALEFEVLLTKYWLLKYIVHFCSLSLEMVFSVRAYFDELIS